MVDSVRKLGSALARIRAGISLFSLSRFCKTPQSSSYESFGYLLELLRPFTQISSMYR